MTQIKSEVVVNTEQVMGSISGPVVREDIVLLKGFSYRSVKEIKKRFGVFQ